MKIKLLLTILLLPVAFATAQVKIKINKSIQYQKIEGFGGNIEYYGNSERTGSPIISDKHANDIVNDLGATIFRHLIDGSMEIKNDNDDPFNTDLSKYNIRKPDNATQCEGNVHFALDAAASSFKKVRALAEKNTDKALLYTTVFSPQAWTKYINCVIGNDPLWNRMATDEEEILKGGTDGVGPAKTKDFKDEFAEFCYAYMKLMDGQGLKVDAFSIQNEPVFPEPYSSCVYSPESYAAVFKRVGKRLRDNGYASKMIFTEDIGDLGRYNLFVKPIVNDPLSVTFADIAAVHGYASNGITAGSTDANLWRSLDKVSRQKSLPNTQRSFWQTETSGYKNHWDIAISIYTGLKFGKLNAWMHHQLFTNGGLLDEGKDTKNFQYYGCKHFFKYVKQGSISVDALPTEDKILATAFQDDKRKTLSVVLINADTVNEKSVQLELVQTNGVPTTYTMYLTTKETATTANAQNLCVNKGTVNAGATFKIPAKGIVTLVGEGSLPEMPTSNEEATTNETSQELMVYPNPSAGQITLRFANSTKEKIEIMDAQLKTVNSEIVDFSNETADLDISHLSNGIYYLKVKNQVKKVVINK